MTWDELTTEMNGKMQFPGWTNAWTMPIKTRVDMLTTGVRTPVGIKVFGDRPQRDRARRRRARARCWRRSAGRAACSTSATWAASTSTSSPSRDELARYGLRVADVERVIESAIGGAPIGTTDRGAQPLLDQRPLPAGPAQRPRIAAAACWFRSAAQRRRPTGGGGAPMGTQGALEAPRRTGVRVGGRGRLAASDLPRARTWRAWAAAPRRRRRRTWPRPRLPTRAGVERPTSDAAAMAPHGAPIDGAGAGGMPPASAAPRWPRRRAPAGAAASFVPLGQVADIKVAGGPPMVRDEAGLLVGYVYVDIDQAQRDIGGYVNEAKEVVGTRAWRAAS